MVGTTRRVFLSATATTTLSGLSAATLALPGSAAAATASAAHPDAELIGLCGQVVEFERQASDALDRVADLLSTDPAYKAAYAEQARLDDLQKPILDRIYELPTRTLDGFRARGRAIMASDHGQMEREQDHQGQLYSLMHDLVVEDGATDPSEVRDAPLAPDADVLALADRFMELHAERQAIDAGKPATDEEVGDLLDEQGRLLDAVQAHTITTPAGHRARAQMLAAWLAINGRGKCPIQIDEQRIWPLFRDLIGGPV